VADDFGVQGLNGPEIIDDIVAQFRKRLENDGILRPQDSYSRGYSAKITYLVECYGLDKESATREMVIGQRQDDEETEVVDGTFDIPQEQDLSEVRDRIEAAIRDQGGEEEESGEPVAADEIRTRRKYTRKLKLAAAGGAEEFQEK
jgi:hypothetical protein